jgi:activator of HSP90 ATPase
MTELRRRDIPAALGFALAGFSLIDATQNKARAGAREDAARKHLDEGLSFSAEAIHQEVLFDAPPARIYATLLDARAFDAVSKLGMAAQSGADLGRTPTAIGGAPGDAFTIFGGYISGRHIELVPDRLVVQAWREASWPAGHYSLARFELNPIGAGTKLVFDHTGFPQGSGHHLSYGWYGDYWNPMKAFLAQQ